MFFKLYNSDYLSAYQIFLEKGNRNFSHAEILKLLDIESYKPLLNEEDKVSDKYLYNRICIIEDDDWIFILDDIYYLWNHISDNLYNRDRDIIGKLSREFSQVLTAFNDSEMFDTYTVQYYKNAILKRFIDLESLSGNDIPIKGIGEPLKGEPVILNFSKRDEISIRIAQGLGIKIMSDITNASFYIYDSYKY